jgi:hypothetical protein
MNQISREQKEELYDCMFQVVFKFSDCCERIPKALICLYEANIGILDMRFDNQLPDVHGLKLKTEQMFSLLGHALATPINYDYYYYDLDNIIPYIHNIFTVVFDLPNFEIEQEGCISPFTLFLLDASKKNQAVHEDFYEDFYDSNDFHYNPETEDDKQKKLEWFHLLIKKGCDVNAMDIQISEPRLNEVKQCVQVPDALFICFLEKNTQYVEVLIQHWWTPPLALLLLCTRCKDVAFWLPFLMQYDALPSGTALYRALHVHLMSFEDSCWIVMRRLEIRGDNTSKDRASKNLSFFITAFTVGKMLSNYFTYYCL